MVEEHETVLDVVPLASQPVEPTSQHSQYVQEGASVDEPVSATQVSATQVSVSVLESQVTESNETNNERRIPNGYIYLLSSPTSSLVKCGSTKDISLNNERYLSNNGVIDIMYFPVYLRNDEHIFNYEMCFHRLCQGYRHNPKVSPESPPIAPKLQTNNITKNVKWERVKRTKDPRQELYERRNGDIDLLEYYQEVLCDIVCGHVPSSHAVKKKRFVNCCSACVH